jgi:hypothetical protein
VQFKNEEKLKKIPETLLFDFSLGIVKVAIAAYQGTELATG